MSAERGLYSAVASSSDSPGVLDDEDISDGSLNESDPLLLNDMAPKDRYSCVYLIFYLFGLGGLLPWNFFITARDYWMYKLGDFNTTVPDSTIAPLVTTAETASNSTVFSDYTYNSSSTTQPNVGPQATTLQSLFMNSLAVCAMLPNVIFQFLNTLLQKRINQHVRILTTLILMIILFIITEILVKVDTSTWQNTFFSVTLVTIVILNSCSAIFQSSGFGMAARFPLRYCGAVMAGQGIGGVFAAVAMIISLACSSNPTDSAFVFFLFAIASLVITIICYLLLTKLTFYKYFTASLQNRNSSQKEDLKLDSPINDGAENEKFIPPEPINGDIEVRHNSYSKTSSSDERIEYSESSDPLMHIARKIWLHMFCIVYVFTITLACFPAVTASIKSMSSGNDWTDIYFTPVCCFLLFNLADWIGRTSATYIHIPSPDSKISLLVLVLARTVFPFLFALCNYQPRYYLPVVFKQDVFFIIFMILFAVSNGHLSTLSMQYGPKQVEEEHSATAGSMLAFMISVGLLAGAGTSFLVTSLI